VGPHTSYRFSIADFQSPSPHFSSCLHASPLSLPLSVKSPRWGYIRYVLLVLSSLSGSSHGSNVIHATGGRGRVCFSFVVFYYHCHRYCFSFHVVLLLVLCSLPHPPAPIHSYSTEQVIVHTGPCSDLRLGFGSPTEDRAGQALAVDFLAATCLVLLRRFLFFVQHVHFNLSFKGISLNYINSRSCILSIMALVGQEYTEKKRNKKDDCDL